MIHGGRVSEIWRYPVKSMLGERLDEVELGLRGVTGDRAYGVLDVGRGSVLSAKREPSLFRCSARYAGGVLEVELPDGRVTRPGDELDRALTDLIGRPVTLVRAASFPHARLQGEVEGDEPSEWDAPEGTFFDASHLHLLASSTLRHFSGLYPEGRFEARRFRPNFVIETAGDGLVDEETIGHALRIGSSVVQVTKPCSRCVMTSHAQAELPRDPGILRTVAQRNSNNLGVRASVVEPGPVRVGDEVRAAAG